MGALGAFDPGSIPGIPQRTMFVISRSDGVVTVATGVSGPSRIFLTLYGVPVVTRGILSRGRLLSVQEVRLV